LIGDSKSPACRKESLVTALQSPDRLPQEQPDNAPSPFVPFMQRLQNAAVLDRVGNGLGLLADRLLGSADTREALRGTWFGHALHPMLTDLPLGAWMCTTLLDVFGGQRSRPAAEGLLAFGLATAVPTAVTGLAEWQATEGSTRRVGVAHASANGLVLGLYGASLLARRRGRHGLGVALGLGGGALALMSGYLGGHMTIVDKVGTGDPAWYESGPASAGISASESASESAGAPLGSAVPPD
jgi:hypothetical protein